MGWDSADRWTKKSDVKAYLQSGIFNGKILSLKPAKNGYWVLLDCPDKIVIVMALIEKRSERGQKRVWLKTMGEASGPFQYDCPLSFLDRAPEADKDWRAKVREHSAREALAARAAKAIVTTYTGPQVLEFLDKLASQNR